MCHAPTRRVLHSGSRACARVQKRTHRGRCRSAGAAAPRWCWWRQRWRPGRCLVVGRCAAARVRACVRWCQRRQHSEIRHSKHVVWTPGSQRQTWRAGQGATHSPATPSCPGAPRRARGGAPPGLPARGGAGRGWEALEDGRASACRLICAESGNRKVKVGREQSAARAQCSAVCPAAPAHPPHLVLCVKEVGVLPLVLALLLAPVVAHVEVRRRVAQPAGRRRAARGGADGQHGTKLPSHGCTAAGQEASRRHQHSRCPHPPPTSSGST